MKNQGAGRVTEERKRQVGQFFMGTDDKKAAGRKHFDDSFDGRAQCRLLIIGQQTVAQKNYVERSGGRKIEQIMTIPADVFSKTRQDNVMMAIRFVKTGRDPFRREFLEAAFAEHPLSGAIQEPRIGIGCDYLQGGRKVQSVPEHGKTVWFLAAGTTGRPDSQPLRETGRQLR